MVEKGTLTRRTAGLLGTAALVALAAGCGEQRQRRELPQAAPSAVATALERGAGTASTSEGGYLHYDGDNDERTQDEPGGHDDDVQPAAYPSEATAIDRRAIASVVKRYFAAAERGDAASACALLRSSLASELDRQRSGGCRAALSQLFGEEHAQLLADDVATMVLIGARVGDEDNVSTALLGFRAEPEQEILVEREGKAWKLGSPLGSSPP
jgi:hypothetical protein